MLNKNLTYLITGCGGFVGGHLANYLCDQGCKVIGVDIKKRSNWFQIPNNLFVIDNTDLQTDWGIDQLPIGNIIFNLASDMGGAAYLNINRARSMLNATINNKLLEFALHAQAQRYFFASSANVIENPNQDGYVAEKIFSEKTCSLFKSEFGLETRVARFFNLYGSYCDYDSGRERVIGALCRKFCEIKYGKDKNLEIFGDGVQGRGFTHIDDCIQGILKVTFGDWLGPTNIGNAQLGTINEIIDILEDHTKIKVNRIYRNNLGEVGCSKGSDNALTRERFNWEPSIQLWKGLRPTFDWIEEDFLRKGLNKCL